MKDNTLLLLAAEAMLMVLGCVGLFCGEAPLAYTAAGAAGALLAGHLNGVQKGGSDGPPR